MFRDPEPLPEGHWFTGFTADATLAWVIAYAGPCNHCEHPGGEKPHAQLYLLPMIGWLHSMKPGDEIDGGALRPAYMSPSGNVSDYLEVPENFTFIAILLDNENTMTAAKELYRERTGGARTIEHIDEISSAN